MESVVFLTSEFPFPVNSGPKIREAHFINLLLERFDVEVVCFSSETSSSTALALPPEYEPIPDKLRVTYVPRERTSVWKYLIHAFRPSLITAYNDKMVRALRERAKPGRVLWISQLCMGQYLHLAHSLGYRVILDEHTVESRLPRNAGRASFARWFQILSSSQMARYEGQFCAEADAVVATSDIDASRLQKLAPKKRVHVIPNAVDLPIYESVRRVQGTTLFFSGALDYAPNVEGLHWFLSEILPKLRNSLGSGLPRIVIAGPNPSLKLSKLLKDNGIETHANPTTILPLLSDASVVFVPLRSGSGTRFKILEAMAAGRAVVSTGKGAEGLVLTPSRDIWIADKADAFATAILRLLRDPELRTKTGAFAVQTVEQRYDWRCTRPLIQNLLNLFQEQKIV